MNAAKKPPRPPTVVLHAFTQDPDTPGDDYSGLGVCLCGKPGREGDDQHPVDAPPLVAVFDPARVLPPKPEADRSDAWIGDRSDS